jgi:phosphate:Na+ symporter
MATCCAAACARSMRNPLLAVGAGTVLAICLQSATAVALIVGSFVGSGIVGATSGLLAVLGADLGSALVVKLLSFDLSFLVPLCLSPARSLFMSTERREGCRSAASSSASAC